MCREVPESPVGGAWPDCAPHAYSRRPCHLATGVRAEPAFAPYRRQIPDTLRGGNALPGQECHQAGGHIRTAMGSQGSHGGTKTAWYPARGVTRIAWLESGLQAGIGRPVPSEVQPAQHAGHRSPKETLQPRRKNELYPVYFLKRPLLKRTLNVGDLHAEAQEVGKTSVE
jgi:hypothetical protein